MEHTPSTTRAVYLTELDATILATVCIERATDLIDQLEKGNLPHDCQKAVAKRYADHLLTLVDIIEDAQ